VAPVASRGPFAVGCAQPPHLGFTVGATDSPKGLVGGGEGSRATGNSRASRDCSRVVGGGRGVMGGEGEDGEATSSTTETLPNVKGIDGEDSRPTTS